MGLWLESHLTGLSLGMAVAYFFLGVPLTAFPSLAGWSMATLLVVELADNHLARRRTAHWILRRWTLGWPTAGELGAIIMAFWFWQRLTGIDPLPLPIFAWIAGSAGAVLALTRRPGSRWQAVIAPLVVLIPVIWTYAGLAEAQPVSRLGLLVTGAIAAPLLHRLLEQGPGRHSARLAWLWLLVLTGLWLADPLLHAEAVGAGDAQWYTTVLADAITQNQSGTFPPLIGQSIYAFNGSIFPGAFAPYYQVAGVALRVLTAGALPVYSIQHLLAFGSILGGMLAVHWVLRRKTGAPHAYCVGLAILYGACPAWLGAIYSMDMYMTLLTMPWLPLVFHGCLRGFRPHGQTPIVWPSASLAIVWLAHPPIGLWTSLIVATVHAWRLLLQRKSWTSELRWLLQSAGLFAALTCLPVVFALQTAHTSDSFRHDYVLETLAAHWRNSWLPVSSGAALISDQQLGWSVALLGGGLLLRRSDNSKAFLVGAMCLFLLLAPIPGVQSTLWSWIPETIKSITDNWPTQRLLPVLATVLIVAGGTAVLRSVAEHPRRHRFATAALLVAVCWSLSEARKFRARGYDVTASAETSTKRLLPENIVLSRYAYHMFSNQPTYVSDGVMNPILKQSLLDPVTLQPIVTNLSAARTNGKAKTITLRLDPSAQNSNDLSPTLQLYPGLEYLLEFELGVPFEPGTLILRGEHLEREYVLSHEPGGSSIGDAEGQRRHVSLWTTGNTIEIVRMSFYPQQPGEFSVRPATALRLTEIPAISLPVQLDGQTPYRATVQSPVTAWLETSRMFVPGYSAKYNGTPVEVRASPVGLVLVRVPAGIGHVELTYHFPPPIQAALMITVATWAALGVIALRNLLRRQTQPSAPPKPRHTWGGGLGARTACHSPDADEISLPRRGACAWIMFPPIHANNEMAQSTAAAHPGTARAQRRLHEAVARGAGGPPPLRPARAL
ncbi:MAG: hypothetical protein RL324_679 [Verrucomicrobiota bacterium]|jgi:hypothetical protein